MDRLEYKAKFHGVNPQVHRCDVCRTYFAKSLFFMYNHVRRHRFKCEPFDCQETNLELYYCEICECEFDTIVHLRKHIAEEHSVEAREEGSSPVYETKSYICQQCPFETCSYLHWFRHALGECYMISASQENPVASEEPTKNNTHLQSHHLEPQTADEPTNIKYKRLKNINLEKRFTVQFDEEQKKWFKCKECTFKTSRKTDWNVHFIVQHGENNKNCLRCEQCKYKTLHKGFFNKHCLTHVVVVVDKENTWFECEQCTFKTLHRASLDRHLITQHGTNKNKKWFQCEQCSFETLYKSHLKKHYVLQHTDDKDKTWLSCERCKFKTLHKDVLKRHFTARHEDEKNKKWFECEQCPLKTLRKSHLRRHVISKHTDDKDKNWLNCEHCTFKTLRKDYLKSHLVARHTDGKDKE